MAWPSTSEPASGEPDDQPHQRARSFFLGRVGYGDAALLQHALVQECMSGASGDTFLFLEHPPVITLGRGSHADHLLASKEVLSQAGAEIWETTRGGDITYHGPGQLVGYGILDLKRHGRDLGLYLRQLEEALIRTLARYGITGSRRQGMTGAWVGDRKVAAIGVRAERWVTSHGFALNVDPDLSHFEWIIPCGIRDYQVTSVAQLLQERKPGAVSPGLQEVAERAQESLGEVFGMRIETADPALLETLSLPSEPPLGGITRRFPEPTGRSADGRRDGFQEADDGSA